MTIPHSVHIYFIGSIFIKWYKYTPYEINKINKPFFMLKLDVKTPNNIRIIIITTEY